ncbi:rab GTPase-binding effector protein 1 isoform X1 [Phlebotomus papatasi]|uniref:rab GTPase-binding effector protein 1 isoform X1 n=1 Tax=Phlebotomus papatasi TaxID=29031 RepID=UPI0024834044|nr:rab GTPase-binding effector protein 1 isoform X1 [Phlebotomus papatasi]
MDEKVTEVNEEESESDGQVARADAPVVTEDSTRAELTEEIRKLREEFNGQRAKMRELYLQKEAECKKQFGKIEALTKELDEAKSQLIVAEYRKENEMQNQELKAQEELASLRQLVQETLDESSTLKDDQKRLYDEYERIRQENHNLKEMLSNQESPSLAPVLSHVKKIARKLGADSKDDTLEDSMRKVNKYAQEDAEVLRSLVVPLEEEIKALKEKLRATDEELQSFRGGPASDSAIVGLLKDTQPAKEPKSAVDGNLPCEMCKNYEMQLVQAQENVRKEQTKTEQVMKQVERVKEDLDREAVLRRELEAQWQEKREQHKNEVVSLTEHIKKTEDSFAHLQRHYNEIKDEINQELLKLTHERESVHRHLESLQRDNDILAGKYLATSEEIQNQEINLPNTVEELQEMLLQVHQSLIEARVGCEFEQTKSISLRDESQLLRDQLESFYKERQAYEREVVANLRSSELQLKESMAKVRQLTSLKEAYERKELEYKKESSELREQAIDLRALNTKLEKANADLKGKVTTLQQDLANGEAVQQDFVRLSQSLQMQLEKIRVADTQVRWQDDEDVDQCSNCKSPFTVTKRKQHCRHCGTIYCDKCLGKSVPSGPHKKPARVCDVCHTLLVRNTAPYFSQAPPQTP